VVSSFQGYERQSSLLERSGGSWRR
jgi:hypothetical protein